MQASCMTDGHNVCARAGALKVQDLSNVKHLSDWTTAYGPHLGLQSSGRD